MRARISGQEGLDRGLVGLDQVGDGLDDLVGVELAGEDDLADEGLGRLGGGVALLDGGGDAVHHGVVEAGVVGPGFTW